MDTRRWYDDTRENRVSTRPSSSMSHVHLRSRRLRVDSIRRVIFLSSFASFSCSTRRDHQIYTNTLSRVAHDEGGEREGEKKQANTMQRNSACTVASVLIAAVGVVELQVSSDGECFFPLPSRASPPCYVTSTQQLSAEASPLVSPLSLASIPLATYRYWWRCLRGSLRKFLSRSVRTRARNRERKRKRDANMLYR